MSSRKDIQKESSENTNSKESYLFNYLLKNKKTIQQIIEEETQLIPFLKLYFVRAMVHLFKTYNIQIITCVMEKWLFEKFRQTGLDFKITKYVYIKHGVRYFSYLPITESLDKLKEFDIVTYDFINS